MRDLFFKTKQLTEAPENGFAPQMFVTVADALLVDSAAASNTVAVAVLHQCIAGTAGRQGDLDRVRKRLAYVLKGLKKVASQPVNRYSPESVAQRLASPFFMPDATAHPEFRTTVQQAKADAAARAKADASRPGKRN
jgi:hypothetical protein